MDPVPYRIREEDVDEVLSAYAPVGGSWTDEQRAAARELVMSRTIEIDETVRTAPEDRRLTARGQRAEPAGSDPGDDSPRRGMALAAIEDLLIRDGFIDLARDEDRIFPVSDRG
jgi:hypothetical protein